MRHRRGEEPAGPRPRRLRPGRDRGRGAQRWRPDRAQGGRPPDPGALPPVRALRDRHSRDARPVDRLGDGRARVRRGGGARAGGLVRGPSRPPGHHRRARLRGDRRRLRRRFHAGRRAARRPRPDRHDAALAGPDLRRHGRGGPGVRPRHGARTCRGSCSWTRSRTRPRRRCASPTRSATGCTASGSTRRPSAAGSPPELVHEVRARLDQAGFRHVKIVVSGGLNPERIRILQGEGRARRLVRRRLVHQRRDSDRLHGRHQGDRRPADREARPDPRPDRSRRGSSRST